MHASVGNIPSSPTLISNRENKKNANVPDLNCVGGLSIATNQQSLAEQQGPGQLDILIREIAEGGLYILYREGLYVSYTRRHIAKFRIFSWHPQTSLPHPPQTGLWTKKHMHCFLRRTSPTKPQPPHCYLAKEVCQG